MAKVEAAAEYRVLEILAILMNEVQQKVLVTTLVVTAIPSTAVGVVLMIRVFKSGVDFIVLALAICLLANGIMALVLLLGGMAKLYLESEKCCECIRKLCWNSGYSRMNIRWIRLFSRSCRLITAKFGSLNFIEPLTPLNCIDFVSGLVVQLLLLNVINI